MSRPLFRARLKAKPSTLDLPEDDQSAIQYIYIYMSPIPFGLMRLGFLSSIMKTQANFVYGTLIYTYTSRHGFTNYTLIFNI